MCPLLIISELLDSDGQMIHMKKKKKQKTNSPDS